jgi:glutaredoxin
MWLTQLSDKIRFRLHDALSSTAADQSRPVKLARDLLATLNDLAGRPLCTEAELRDRRADVAPGSSTPDPTAAREPAPVMLYFDGKDHRTKKKIEELLSARDIPFTVLDVTDDEATRSWASATAKQIEFPLVFIAGEPIGGLHEITQADVNGALKQRVWGTTS